MSNFAPAAEAATKIITFLAENEKEIGISEISRGVDLNKNMVFRILNSLEKEGWVYCNDQKYALTLLPFKVASAALSRMSLNTVSLPILYDLLNKTGESTYLGVLDEDRVLYLQHLDGVKSVRVAGRVGGRYELYCSAPGKVLLANSCDEFINKYTDSDFEKRTENTLIEKNQIKDELEKVRCQGYATDMEEFGKGIVCAAAPVYDYSGKVIAAVGCSAFATFGKEKETVDALLPHVISSANEISKRLGYKL